KGALKSIAAERLFKRGSDVNESANLYLEGFLDSGAEDLLERVLEIIKGANLPDLEEKILKTLIPITGERARKTGYQAALSALVNKRIEGIEELKQMLVQTENPEVKSQLLFKIGQGILKKDINSKEGEEALLRSFELNHKSSEAGWAVAGLYTHLERYKELEEFLTSWLGFADDAGIKCEIHLKLGRIWEEIFNNPKKATAHYQMALELNPRERGALSRLINLFSGTGKWSNVVEILERGLRDAQDREEENIYLEELGSVLFEKLKDINAAEKYFRRLRSQDPRNRRALAFYENYYAEKGDYQKLFSTLSFILTTAEDNVEKVRISLKMADISENRLHNLDRAIEAYRRVLLIDPDNRQAEDSLVVLLEKTKKWHTIVEFYNDRIRRLPDEQKEEKVAYLFRIIDIYQDADKLPMEEMVFHTYSRVAEVSPGNTVALNSLAKSLEERKRWSELLSVLQKKVTITDDPVELLELFHQIANIMIEQMSNETQAIPFLEKILEIDPQNADIPKKLKEIYRRKHNIEKLFEMNLKELGKVGGAEKEALLFELGTFAMENLFKYEEALGYFEELYAMNPSNRKAFAMIQNLYVRLGSWERYAAFLERHIPQEREQKPRLELMERLGNLYLDKLRDLEKAKEVFRDIIRISPENSYAVGVLEKIYIQEEDYPSLKELFSIRSDLRGYCALLQNELAKTGEKDKQVSLNVELSSVYSDMIGDKAKGMRFLEAVVRAAPERGDLAEQVISHYKEKGEREKVRDLLKITAAHITDRTEKIRNLEEIYNIENSLKNPGGAFEALLGLVKFDLSRNSVERMPEAAALAEKTGQFNFFASELSKELEGYYSADILKVLIKTLAEIYREKLFFYDDALALYKRLLDIDPSDREALDFLEDIALHKRDYNELEAVYRHRIDLAKTGAESAAVYRKLAQLYEEILNDDEKAAQCFGEILRLEEWDKDAFGGLRRCLGRLGHYFELFDLLNNAASLENDPGEKKSLMLEAARISSSRL
ncbi:MAG: hypothetical protein FJ088_04570, partial [Deltaproteobacteria bacterium]|nr:hypothetical protein [Deltaproteobacteria bacterium]